MLNVIAFVHRIGGIRFGNTVTLDHEASNLGLGTHCSFHAFVQSNNGVAIWTIPTTLDLADASGRDQSGQQLHSELLVRMKLAGFLARGGPVHASSGCIGQACWPGFSRTFRKPSASLRDTSFRPHRASQTSGQCTGVDAFSFGTSTTKLGGFNQRSLRCGRLESAHGPGQKSQLCQQLSDLNPSKSEKPTMACFNPEPQNRTRCNSNRSL